MTEILRTGPERKPSEHGENEYATLHEQLERRRTHEAERQLGEKKDIETTTHEAVREAAESRPEHRADTPQNQPERRTRPLNRKELDHAFNAEMSAARLHMSPASRSFSKVIHNKTVERISDAAASTIARPNAILYGSLFAFVIVLGTYLVAKYFGYILSGSETMIAFLLGWVIGLIYDYIRVTLRGKAS